MNKLILTVRDVKAETWSDPVVADNKAAACRMFGDLVRDGRTLVGQHPEDFELYIVGVWHGDAGYADCERKGIDELLARGSDFVVPETK